MAVGAEQQRQVQVMRGRYAQCLLQQNLARRGVDQVRAAHHVADALLGVVHDHRQLIGPETIGPQQDEIAYVTVHVLRDRPLQRVVESHMAAVGHAQADGRLRALLAGHTVPMDAVLAGQIGAAAVAMEGLALRQQSLTRCVVKRMAVALVLHGFVGMQAKGGQCGELLFRRAGDFARRVHVLYPDQPPAVGMARQQPTAEGSQH
ncbi:hypothetical protein D3C71_1498830 [compost metagenome]